MSVYLLLFNIIQIVFNAEMSPSHLKTFELGKLNPALYSTVILGKPEKVVREFCCLMVILLQNSSRSETFSFFKAVRASVTWLLNLPENDRRCTVLGCFPFLVITRLISLFIGCEIKFV